VVRLGSAPDSRVVVAACRLLCLPWSVSLNTRLASTASWISPHGSRVGT
jgi:hypothetical protein